MHCHCTAVISDAPLAKKNTVVSSVPLLPHIKEPPSFSCHLAQPLQDRKETCATMKAQRGHCASVRVIILILSHKAGGLMEARAQVFVLTEVELCEGTYSKFCGSMAHFIPRHSRRIIQTVIRQGCLFISKPTES